MRAVAVDSVRRVAVPRGASVARVVGSARAGSAPAWRGERARAARTGRQRGHQRMAAACRGACVPFWSIRYAVGPFRGAFVAQVVGSARGAGSPPVVTVPWWPSDPVIEPARSRCAVHACRCGRFGTRWACFVVHSWPRWSVLHAEAGEARVETAAVARASAELGTGSLPGACVPLWSLSYAVGVSRGAFVARAVTYAREAESVRAGDSATAPAPSTARPACRSSARRPSPDTLGG